jgi:hypothetical protein
MSISDHGYRTHESSRCRGTRLSRHGRYEAEFKPTEDGTFRLYMHQSFRRYSDTADTAPGLKLQRTVQL